MYMHGPEPEQSLEDYAQSCVSIDLTDMVNEYRRVSADLAYWNNVAAEYEHAAMKARANLKSQEGTAHLNAGNILRGQGIKATVDNCKALVPTLPSVVVAQESLAQATYDLKQARGICEAVAKKGDMLVSIGAHLRREMDTARTAE